MDYEQVSYIFLVFLLLLLNVFCALECFFRFEEETDNNMDTNNKAEQENQVTTSLFWPMYILHDNRKSES